MATAIAAVLAGAVAGGAAALSAGFAGLACALPNGVFAWLLRHAVQPSVALFVIGELLKLLVVAGLLAGFWLEAAEPRAGWMLLGMLFALQANFFGLLTRN